MAETPRRRRAAPDPANRWKPGERELRTREVTRQSYATIAQIIIAAVAVVGVFIAVIAALKAGDAVDVAKRGIQSNADENRLSTAVDAIGGDDPTQRVAGLTLLRRLASQRLENALEDGASDSDRRDARRLYSATVEILATFLKTSTASPGQGADSGLPVDALYAADDLRQWVDNEKSYRRLVHGGAVFTTEHRKIEYPNVDLTGAYLFGVPWRGIDFRWLGSRYLPAVDLRRATLTDSKWGRSTLSSAQLQCAKAQRSQFRASDFQGADLRDADFGNAELQGGKFPGADLARVGFNHAKLEGANFTDADLSGADLAGAKLGGAHLTNAHLNDADLGGADLTGADLTGADLTGARLDNSTPAHAYETTSHPECP